MRYLQQTKVIKKAKIDVRDKKILSLLANNARTPYSKIAKHCTLSRDSIAYRINNLVKEGVIQGYRVVVDINKFGYDAYHLFLQLSILDKKVEQELIKKFQTYHFTRAVIRFSGKYDFEIALIAKNIKEFEQNLNKVLEDCSKYLKSYEVLIITKPYIAKVFPKSFSDDKNAYKIESKNDNFKIDEKDKEILLILSEDSTLPYYEIAKKVKLSHDAVSYRIKNMINSGIIKKFVPVINFASLSYNIYAILLNINKLDKNNEDKLRIFLENSNDILWAVKCVGKYNLLIYVCVKEIEELHKVIDEIRNSFRDDVKDYETLIAYESYKYTYFPDYVHI